MVKTFSLAILLAGAMVAQACTYCQCLKTDGSHCCLYSNAGKSYQWDCATFCKNARSLDGEYCSAGGSYTCDGAFTAQFRTGCYTQGEP